MRRYEFESSLTTYIQGVFFTGTPQIFLSTEVTGHHWSISAFGVIARPSEELMGWNLVCEVVLPISPTSVLSLGPFKSTEKNSWFLNFLVPGDFCTLTFLGRTSKKKHPVVVWCKHIGNKKPMIIKSSYTTYYSSANLYTMIFTFHALFWSTSTTGRS